MFRYPVLTILALAGRPDRGWLLDFTHHKIYLTNPPSEIQTLQITNGMNQFAVSRGFRHGLFSYAFGAGPVITFPINNVRNQKLEGRARVLGGYYLSGANIMASAARRFPIVAPLFLSLNGRVSATYVSVPVAGGHASVPNVAFHFHVGGGFEFGHRTETASGSTH